MTRLVGALSAVLLLASVAHAGERAVLENVKTEWQNAYGAIIYTVLADVKNVSDAPIQCAKIKVELFDKDGKLVAERSGYNVGAEVLEQDEVPGSVDEKLQRVKPIAPGHTDLFRLSLDKTDIGKPFRKVNVVLVEVK
jgi:hypothetical protein